MKKDYRYHCVQFSEKTKLVWNTKESMKNDLKKYTESNRVLKRARHLGGEIQSFAQKQINANNGIVESLMTTYYQLQGELHTLYEKHYDEFLERLNSRPKQEVKKIESTFEESISGKLEEKTKSLRKKTVESILKAIESHDKLPIESPYLNKLKIALKKELDQQ
jgi:alpha-galactosidase/6-phospho-beta-glucosidase family protein